MKQKILSVLLFVMSSLFTQWLVAENHAEASDTDANTIVKQSTDSLMIAGRFRLEGIAARRSGEGYLWKYEITDTQYDAEANEERVVKIFTRAVVSDRGKSYPTSGEGWKIYNLIEDIPVIGESSIFPRVQMPGNITKFVAISLSWGVVIDGEESNGQLNGKLTIPVQ